MIGQTTRRVPGLLRAGLLSCRHQSGQSSSGQPSPVLVDMDDSTGVATVSLNLTPVNMMSAHMMEGIHTTLSQLNMESKGVILTSALPGIFSAGLDLSEIYQANKDSLLTFWHHLQEIFVQIYSARIPYVAAINGHAPAGGCMMTLCTDYRVMAEGKTAIGLNEAMFGILPPVWFSQLYMEVLGTREASRGLTRGTMYPASSALQVGLVDRLVPSDQVLDSAKEEMAKLLKIPDSGRGEMKTTLRKPFLNSFQATREQEKQQTVDYLLSDTAQRCLGAYLQSLKKPKKAK